jgi:16S rRNA (guanine527-N7)-methyltransferase
MRRPPVSSGPPGFKRARVKVRRVKEAKVDFVDALREDRERALASLDVSRETVGRLDAYVDLLVKWQRAINLVAPSTLKSLWTRHILDSAQIATLGAKHQSWADLGSGAGFPGLIIAILARDLGRDPARNLARDPARDPATEWPEPGLFHLIESDQRKASFLREAARVTSVSVEIHACRAEDILPELRGKVTAVTARALAPLPSLLALAEPLLTTGAEGFFPKGETLSSELQRASEVFAFESRAVPSQSDEKGRILVIRDLRRRPASIGHSGDRK